MVALRKQQRVAPPLEAYPPSQRLRAQRIARRLNGVLSAYDTVWCVYSEGLPSSVAVIVVKAGAEYVYSERMKNGETWRHLFTFDGMPVDSDIPWREYPCYRVIPTPGTSTVTRKQAGPNGILYTDGQGSRQALTDVIPVPGVPGLDVSYVDMGMADPFQPTGGAVELSCDAAISHEKAVSDDLTPGTLYRTPHFAGRPLPLMSVVTFNDSEWLKFDAGYGGVIHCKRADVQAVR